MLNNESLDEKMEQENSENQPSTTEVSKDKIKSEMAQCLKEIDPRFYNPSFNLMSEIVNIFGDIDFEKVKIDIDRLTQIDMKLDNVIKLLVEKHSDEFYKILGYVREMKKMLELSKLKYDYAKVSISSITGTISNLTKGENDEWKLMSIFCNEIVGKLSKTQNIFEIIKNCESYIENEKLYDAIELLKNSKDVHIEYDKEFRNFNLLVNVNIRFKKIEEEITNKLLHVIDQVIFFDNELIQKRKIASLISFFVNYYSKISIDTELVKPLTKFISVINQTVTYNAEKELSENLLDKNEEDDKNKNVKKSMTMLIKCIKLFDDPNVMKNFFNEINSKFASLIQSVFKNTTLQLKEIDSFLSKYDMKDKTEKIKFLLLLQVPLIILIHSVAKISLLVKQVSVSSNDSIKIMKGIENAMIVLLLNFRRAIVGKQDENISQYDIGYYYNCENVLRRCLSEMSFISLDYYPILLKIYYQICSALKDYKIELNTLTGVINNYVKELYDIYTKKFYIKSYFDIKSFVNEFDNDSSNFKFINDFNTKIEVLSKLSIFAFDTAYTEIMKILKHLFVLYYENFKTFIEKIKKDCIHNYLFPKLLEEITNNNEIKSKILIDFQFRKYQSNIENKSSSNLTNNYTMIDEQICSFIIRIVQTTKQTDKLYLLTRNFRLVELITKLISNTELLLTKGENFITDIMKKEFTSAKMIAILQQVGQISFSAVVSSETEIDISTLILITLSSFDTISNEIVKALLLLKIEFCCLILTIARNIIKNSYWLNEPQMTPEYFITSFINEFNMYNNVFSQNLQNEEYDFIKKDYLNIINNVFIECIRNMPTNSINSFGVNLLIRDFEYIKEKIGFGFEEVILEKSIFYFPNFIKLISVNADKVEEELAKYKNVIPFSDDFVAPLLKIKTNTRTTHFEAEKNSNLINKLK